MFDLEETGFMVDFQRHVRPNRAREEGNGHDSRVSNLDVYFNWKSRFEKYSTLDLTLFHANKLEIMEDTAFCGWFCNSP